MENFWNGFESSMVKQAGMFSWLKGAPKVVSEVASEAASKAPPKSIFQNISGIGEDIKSISDTLKNVTKGFADKVQSPAAEEHAKKILENAEDLSEMARITGKITKWPLRAAAYLTPVAVGSSIYRGVRGSRMADEQYKYYKAMNDKMQVGSEQSRK